MEKRILDKFNKNPNISKVIMDFSNVEFIGCSFAQKYSNKKHFASFEVVEENVSEDAERCLT